MSDRIVADSSRRVVERPRPRCTFHIVGVGRRDRRERRVIGEPVGEGIEEGGDLVVGAAGELAERRPDAATHGGGGALVLDGRDVQQRAGRRIDDQPIAGPERGGELAGHRREPVAAVHDLLALGERRQLGRVRSAHGRPSVRSPHGRAQ